MYLQIATYLFGFTQGWLCLDDTGCQKSTCYLGMGHHAEAQTKRRGWGDDSVWTCSPGGTWLPPLNFASAVASRSYKQGFCCYFCHWDAAHFLGNNPAEWPDVQHFTSLTTGFVHHSLGWYLGFISPRSRLIFFYLLTRKYIIVPQMKRIRPSYRVSFLTEVKSLHKLTRREPNQDGAWSVAPIGLSGFTFWRIFALTKMVWACSLLLVEVCCSACFEFSLAHASERQNRKHGPCAGAQWDGRIMESWSICLKAGRRGSITPYSMLQI